MSAGTEKYKTYYDQYSDAEFEWNYGGAIFENKELDLPKP